MSNQLSYGMEFDAAGNIIFLRVGAANATESVSAQKLALIFGAALLRRTQDDPDGAVSFTAWTAGSRVPSVSFDEANHTLTITETVHGSQVAQHTVSSVEAFLALKYVYDLTYSVASDSDVLNALDAIKLAISNCRVDIMGGLSGLHQHLGDDMTTQMTAAQGLQNLMSASHQKLEALGRACILTVGGRGKLKWTDKLLAEECFSGAPHLATSTANTEVFFPAGSRLNNVLRSSHTKEASNG